MGFWSTLRAYIANQEPESTETRIFRNIYKYHPKLVDLLKHSLGDDLMDKDNGVLEWDKDSYTTGVLREVLGEEVYQRLRKEVYGDYQI